MSDPRNTDPRNSDRLQQLLKLHAADERDADLPYMVALEYAKLGQATEAIAWLDKCLSLNPHYHYAYFQKAKMLDREGESDDALAVLDVGIAMAQKAGDGKALGEMQDLRQIMQG